MPWVVRDAIDDINQAVGRRWQGLDRPVSWPARDVTGVNGLLRHGMQAMTVIAVRPAESAPFWNRMGYRPLWTGWEVRPAASLR